MTTYHDPDHHDVFPGGKAGALVTPPAAPTFTVTRDLITRVDERGHVTTWRLLTAPERAPKMSTGFPYEAQAVSTFDGRHRRTVTFRMTADLVLAWQMAQ